MISTAVSGRFRARASKNSSGREFLSGFEMTVPWAIKNTLRRLIPWGPPRQRPAPVLLRWRNAVFTIFALSGFVSATWISRIPTMRDLLGASTQQVGLLLVSLSVGAITGLLASSHLLAHISAARAILWCHGGSSILLAV